MASSNVGGSATDGAESADKARSAHPAVAVPPESIEASLPLDEVFALLRNERRRWVLQYVTEFEGAGPVSLSDLAEQLAAWEHDKPVAQLHSEERKRVYVGLYQVHLPKMDDMDVIEFNKARGLIEPGDNIDICLWYLTRADMADAADTRPWPRYYGALSALGAVGLVAARWVQPQTSVPLIEAVTVGVLAAFCSCTGWYWWSEEGSGTTGTPP